MAQPGGSAPLILGARPGTFSCGSADTGPTLPGTSQNMVSAASGLSRSVGTAAYSREAHRDFWSSASSDRYRDSPCH